MYRWSIAKGDIYEGCDSAFASSSHPRRVDSANFWAWPWETHRDGARSRPKRAWGREGSHAAGIARLPSAAFAARPLSERVLGAGPCIASQGGWSSRQHAAAASRLVSRFECRPGDLRSSRCLCPVLGHLQCPCGNWRHDPTSGPANVVEGVPRLCHRKVGATQQQVGGERPPPPSPRGA